MSKNNYIKIAQSITSTKLIKIESWDGYSTLVFIRTSGATGLYSIDGNWADSAKFTRLSGPLGKDHFNAYRERSLALLWFSPLFYYSRKTKNGPVQNRPELHDVFHY